MKRLLVILSLVVLLFATFAFAGPEMNMETLSPTTTVIATPTAASIQDVTKSPQGAIEAFITVGGAGGITFTIDGTTPTTGSSGVGHQVPVGSIIDLIGHSKIRNFQAIGTTTTSTLTCTYFFGTGQ
jgi:hypothetical protein